MLAAGALALALAIVFSDVSTAGAEDQPPPPAAEQGTAPGTQVAPTAAASQAAAPAQESERTGEREPAPGMWPAWLRDPSQWATDVFTHSMVTLLQGVADVLRSAIDGILNSSVNFVTRTPPAVSFESPTVLGLWEISRRIANASLVLVVAAGGLNLITSQQLGALRHDVTELLSRLAIGALLANTSLLWGSLAIAANNALCQAVGGASLPAWERADTPTQALAGVLAGLVYLVTGLLLVLQQLMRLALIDVLLLLAPLAFACYVLPQTQAWTNRWCATFFGAVFVQFLQVATLKLGGALVLELAPVDEGSRIVGMLLGVAVLSLTLKLPALVQAHAGPAVGDGLGFARYYAYRRGAQAMDAARSVAGGRRGGK